MNAPIRCHRLVPFFRTLGPALVAAALSAGSAHAQELEPRLYQNAPVGLNAFALGYGYSSGNILVDSSLPVEGASAKVHGIALGYVRSFGILGKSAKLDVVLPLSWGAFQGVVAGELRTREPSGLADPRFRLAVNLVGAPALSVRDFSHYRQKTIIAASFQVAAPLGQYDPDKLINLGANRWSFRPELGVSRAEGRWYVELALGAWLFSENADYFGGFSLTQDPLYFIKGDVIYNFKRGIWVALNYGFATGGVTRVEGESAATLQRNSRLGITLSFPLARAHSLKIVWTSGLATRLGADFDSLNVLYQYTWMGAGAGAAR
jgi:Putative MetA-pathway of phenol degradation